MESVYLRALETDDVDRTYKWHNDRELYRTMGEFHYVSRTTDEEWLRKKQAFSTSEVNLAICLTNTRSTSAISTFETSTGSPATPSFGFFRRARPAIQGVWPGSRSRVDEHAFEDLGLLRTYCVVLGDDRPAIRAYEKCGFVDGRKAAEAFLRRGTVQGLLGHGACAPTIFRPTARDTHRQQISGNGQNDNEVR